MLEMVVARITSADVARRAGVSQSTVSLVLSGKDSGRVAAGTAELVRRTARQLGYRPNAAAQALRTGAAGAVGLLVPDVTSPFFGLMLRGAQQAAWEAGLSVLLVDTENAPEREKGVLTTLRGGTVDGFLVFSSRAPQSLTVESEPTVLIESEHPGLASVRLDGASGMTALADHLLGLGHRHLAHLASAIDEQTFTRRRMALDAALAARGLRVASRQTAQMNITAARIVAGRMLDETPSRRPTAIVCDDDVLAGGAYLAARDLRLSIPGDVSIVGFDDLPFAVLLDPPLTSVAVDAEALGATALRILLTVMAGGPVIREIMEVSLTVRGSTGPPVDR